MYRILLMISLCAVIAGSALGHEAPQTPAEKAEYIENYLELFEVEARRINTFTDDNVPAIRYAVKNNGSETLKKIEVNVYFLDSQGRPFQEENFFPVWVTGSAFNDDEPLRPNYTFRMDKDKWMTIPNLGDEWSGEIEISIVDIEFAE